MCVCVCVCKRKLYQISCKGNGNLPAVVGLFNSSAECFWDAVVNAVGHYEDVKCPVRSNYYYYYYC